MYVELDIAAGRCQVRDANDLKSFSVHLSEPAGPEKLSRTLGPLGPLGQLAESDHVWIIIDALRAASGRADDAEWSAQFDAMIAYAASQGWVDETGELVRAHVEFGPVSE
jgi:hypothetical protein